MILYTCREETLQINYINGGVKMNNNIKSLTLKEAKKRINAVLDLTLLELEALSLKELKELDNALSVVLSSKLKKADREDYETFKDTLADISARKILEAVANAKAPKNKADKKEDKKEDKKADKKVNKIEESLKAFQNVKIGDKYIIYVKDSDEYEPANCVVKLADEYSFILVDEDLFKYEITFERFNKGEWIKYIDGKRETLILEKVK